MKKKRSKPSSQRYKQQDRRQKNKARKARKQEKIEARHRAKRVACKRAKEKAA